MIPFKGNKRTYGLILVFILLGLIAVAGWRVLSSQKTAATVDVPLVRTQVVQTGNGSQSYKYSGEVRSRYESQLAFQVGGRIISRNVEVGSKVHAGDVLMQIDPQDARHTLEVCAAQLSSAESASKLADDTLNRTRQLYEQGAVSKTQLDQAQNAFDTADAARRQLKAQCSLYQSQLDYTSLRADRDGVITGIYAEVGQVLVTMASAQPVVTLAQDNDLEVEINVPENRIEDFRKAQKLKISFWALTDVILDGKIREVAPMADNVARTFKVRITLINPPPEVKLGMTSTVSADSLNNGSAVAVIPLAAVYQTGNTPSVWVVANDMVSLRNVEIESFDSDRVIVSEGLKTGDVVVTAGVHKLYEGQKVRLKEASQ